MPCLQFDDGRTLTESLVIAEYLDEAYGKERLRLSDPYLHAQNKLAIEAFSKLIPFYYKLVRKEADSEKPFLEALNGFLNHLNDDFLGGRISIFIKHLSFFF